MNELITKLKSKVLNGRVITEKEALELSKVNDIDILCEAADIIRQKKAGNHVELCSIINAKSGKCTEDCKYCAQSMYYHTGINEYGLVSKEKVLKLAKENENNGVHRFSVVTSGRALKGKDFEYVIEIFEFLRKNTSLKLCASLGILSYKQLIELKKIGVSRYHHNLETGRSYYQKICTTHSYQDRIDTIKNAKEAGLTICSGGIIGMDESMIDRIKMAVDLRKLKIKSIPINILNPIKGTPFEEIKPLTQEEILRTIAIFRFIIPDAYIRFAGGRSNLKDYGKKGFKSGANAVLTGNYLTTTGNKICEDIKMLKDLGREVK